MSDWLALARAAASVEPLRPRVALFLAHRGGLDRIGSVEQVLVDRLVAEGLPVHPHRGGLCVDGPADASLAEIAAWLRAAGLAGPWRDELLAVVDERGLTIGAIERGAVRPLGLATSAVHLVGRDHDGRRFWIQQRALDKSTDPGLWDTLMGGQVAFGESIRDTLERETMEEAGLAIDALLGLESRMPMEIRRPVAEGYMIERLEVFRARLRPGAVPVNRDGEVERFDCVDSDTLQEMLQRGMFTLEASLILSAELADEANAGPG